jgi:hypothetical protein
VAAQGDPVRSGDTVRLDGPQSFTEALPGLPQQLEGVGGGVLRSGTIGISPVLLDEMCLKGGSDFVGCLQRVVNSAIPRGVVNHTASIPATCLVPKYLAPSPARSVVVIAAIFDDPAPAGLSRQAAEPLSPQSIKAGRASAGGRTCMRPGDFIKAHATGTYERCVSPCCPER